VCRCVNLSSLPYWMVPLYSYTHIANRALSLSPAPSFSHSTTTSRTVIRNPDRSRQHQARSQQAHQCHTRRKQGTQSRLSSTDLDEQGRLCCSKNVETRSEGGEEHWKGYRHFQGLDQNQSWKDHRFCELRRRCSAYNYFGCTGSSGTHGILSHWGGYR
jgi:hypothetical protein